MPKSIQQMLDTPNADYDPNSPASQARRAEYARDPVADIRSYIANYQHPSLATPTPTATPIGDSHWFGNGQSSLIDHIRSLFGSS